MAPLRPYPAVVPALYYYAAGSDHEAVLLGVSLWGLEWNLQLVSGSAELRKTRLGGRVGRQREPLCMSTSGSNGGAQARIRISGISWARAPNFALKCSSDVLPLDLPST